MTTGRINQIARQTPRSAPWRVRVLSRQSDRERDGHSLIRRRLPTTTSPHGNLFRPGSSRVVAQTAVETRSPRSRTCITGLFAINIAERASIRRGRSTDETERTTVEHPLSLPRRWVDNSTLPAIEDTHHTTKPSAASRHQDSRTTEPMSIMHRCGLRHSNTLPVNTASCKQMSACLSFSMQYKISATIRLGTWKIGTSN